MTTPMLSSVKVFDLGVCVGPFAVSRVRSKRGLLQIISTETRVASRLAARSPRQVAGALNEMGHRTQRGTPWSALTVSASLNRESLNCAPAKWWSGFSASRRRRLAQTDPRSRPILRLILAQRDEGNLYLTIAENLNAEGYRAPCGFPWNVASISNIMSRRGVNHRTAAENA